MGLGTTIVNYEIFDILYTYFTVYIHTHVAMGCDGYLVAENGHNIICKSVSIRIEQGNDVIGHLEKRQRLR